MADEEDTDETGPGNGNGNGNAYAFGLTKNVVEGLTEVIEGTLGDDLLLGLDGADTLIGGSGHDSIDGGAGDDLILGDAETSVGVGVGQNASALVMDSSNLESTSYWGSRASVGDSAIYRDVATLEDGTEIWGRLVLTETSDPTMRVDLAGSKGAEILLKANGVGDTATFRFEFFDPLTGEAVALNGAATFNDIDRNHHVNDVEAVTLNSESFSAFGTSSNTSLEVTEVDSGIRAAGTEANNPDDQDAWFTAQFENRTFIEFTLESRSTQSGFSFSGDLIEDIVVTPIINGSDSIFGGLGADTIYGEGGNDVLDGGDDNDAISGGDGDDSLIGGLGDDTLLGDDGDDTISGGEGSDLIYGGAGNDYLTTGTGNDTVYGGDGNDTLKNSSGDDSLVGGAGDDSIVATLGNDTLEGEDGNDTLYGGDDNDSLDGGAGDDLLYGESGDDMMIGGLGSDVMYGGTGADTISGGDGNDYIDGGDGDDFLTTGLGQDTLIGGEGNDTLMNSDGDDSLVGGAGDDLIIATGGNDTLEGGAGNDTLDGGADNDSIDGGTGDDLILTGTGNDYADGGDDSDRFVVEDGFGTDTLVGGEGGTDYDSIDLSQLTGPVTVSFTDAEAGTITDGTDTLSFSEIEHLNLTAYNDSVDGTLSHDPPGGAGPGIDVDGRDGDDTLLGGSGADTIHGGLGQDSIDGGAGNDWLVGAADSDTITGGAGFDTLFGGAGNDSLASGADDDTVYGGDGDDTIDGGDQADVLYGGAGNDLIEAGAESPGGADDTIYGGLGDDTLTSVEMDAGSNDALYGEEGNDSISVSGGENNLLSGGAGADTLQSAGGSDSLDGGADDDLVTGGGGDDFFVYDAGDGADTITDFNAGNTGTLDDGDINNNDFVNLSGFYDDIRELHADQADDGVLNQSNDGVKGVDYSDNYKFGSGSLTFTGASADGDFFTSDNTGVVCFTSGAAIRTPRGDRLIDDLRVGDLVTTLDNGPRPIRWIGRRHLDRDALRAAPNLRPVLIRRGLMGAERDLLVSPQHGMLLDRDRLVRAKHLAETPGSGIRIAHGKRDVTYIHLMFDAHQIIFSENMPTESFYPGPMAQRLFDHATLCELRELFPDVIAAGLTSGQIQRAFGETARPFLPRHAVPSAWQAIC